MARVTLTDEMLIAIAPAAPGKRRDIMDTEIPGFGVRVTEKAGADGVAAQRTFILLARFPGSANPTRRAIGEYGELSLQEARTTAREWRHMIAEGKNPVEPQRRSRRRTKNARDATFGSVAEDFLRRHVSGQSREKVTGREIRNELVARWRDRPLREITAEDVVTVVGAIAARPAPSHAHNVLGHSRNLFNWALSRGEYGLQQNPCAGLKPGALIGPKQARQRTLSEAEIGALWRAADAIGDPYGPIYKLLLLTGQRPSDFAKTRWSEFDFGRNVWLVPPERGKKATRIVPLSDPAVALLKALPFSRGEFLFSEAGGQRPATRFGRSKQDIDRLMAEDLGFVPERWVTNDICRTVRAGLSAQGEPKEVIERITGRVRTAAVRSRGRDALMEAVTEAMERWSARVRELADQRRDNVIPFRPK